MGGGGAEAMRTAAKVAGIRFSTAGSRGVSVVPPAEQSVRKASRPVSVVVSSQGARAAEFAPLHTTASWDLDDCGFAYEDELVMEAGEPMPRVVFGGAPSFQEAKAATSELKDAIDKIYMSSNSSECEGSSAGGEVSVLSPHSESETKSCVVEAISTPLVRKHALQAFKLLRTNPDAQVVVASVTSDPNVWNAVMQNPMLKDFLQSKQTGNKCLIVLLFPSIVLLISCIMDVDAKCAAVAGFEVEESPEKLQESHDSDQSGYAERGFVYSDSNLWNAVLQNPMLKNFFQSKQTEKGYVYFMGLLDNIKLRVSDMVTGVSNHLQNIFGLPAAEKASSDANGNSKENFMNFFTGGTYMGLAVMVAMVVLLKRI